MTTFRRILGEARYAAHERARLATCPEAREAALETAAECSQALAREIVDTFDDRYPVRRI